MYCRFIATDVVSSSVVFACCAGRCALFEVIMRSQCKNDRGGGDSNSELERRSALPVHCSIPSGNF